MINEDINFCYQHCLASNAVEKMFGIAELDEHYYASVAIIADGDLTEKLLKAFSVDYEFKYDVLDFDRIDYDKDVYALIIDTDGTLSIDKAYFEDGELVTFGEDMIYISGDVNSKILLNQLEIGENVICFNMDDEDCEDEDFDDYEDDEEVDLYDIVESMVEDILEKKFTK
jgi:hypothetical protein